MHGARALRKTVSALFLSLACAAAYADPLGFYVGAAAGKAKPQSDLNLGIFGLPLPAAPFSFPSSTNGWKVFAGIRPVSIFGAESEYVDFGSFNGSATLAPGVATNGINATAATHSTAGALFAVGYLPLPPSLDAFAKAGVAHLRTSVTANGELSCPIELPCLVPVVPSYSASHSGTNFAYGVGVQLRLASLGVRGEYERISASGGDTELLSLGVIWVF